MMNDEQPSPYPPSTIQNEPVAELVAVKPGTIPRRHDLDALRAIAMLLGIALHAALAYIPMPDGGWPVHDLQKTDALGLFLSVVHGFRMPLFFLISGFFTAMLWRKRGLSALIWHRFKRIFLPLILGMVTVIPAIWVCIIFAGGYSARINDTGEINLWQAARTGNTEYISSIDGNTDLNALDQSLGWSPLAIASVGGQDEVIRLLLSKGAEINRRNLDGNTPLHLAILGGHTGSTKMLLENGARIDLKNRLGENPIDVLNANGIRRFIAISFAGFQPDGQSNRAEIAELLQQHEMTPALLDQSMQKQLEIAATYPSSGDQTEAALNGLKFLFIFFPLFHHLWFLWFLCWLVAAFAIYAKLITWVPIRLSSSWIVSPLRYVWLIPLTMLPQSLMGLLFPNFGPDTSTGLVPMPAILLYYAIFFFFGAIYFDCDDPEGNLGRRWKFTLPFAIFVLFPIGYDLTTGELGITGTFSLQPGWCRPLSVAFQVAFAWVMTFGLMGMFRSLFPTESKTMRYVSDSSYWLYVAHLPLIMAIQALMLTWPLPAVIKLILVTAVSTVVLLLSYEWCVRYTPIGTLLNGPRKRPRKSIGMDT